MHRTSAAPKQGQGAHPEASYSLDGRYINLASPGSVKMESPDYPPTTTIGLGIFQNDLVGISVSPSLSIQGWQDQPVIGTTACFQPAMGSPPHYSTLPYFHEQQYASGPILSQPAMRFPSLAPQDQNASIYYSSDISARNPESPVYGDASHWCMTPQPQMKTPLRYLEQQPHVNSPTWKASVSPAVTNYSAAPVLATNPLVDPAMCRTDAKSSEQTPSLDGTECISETDACQHASVEVSTSPDSVISDGGLCCEICGKRFTRKSNCRDHAKRHDPKQRSAYSCRQCGTTFGRMTDLRRHYTTRAHDGQKKFDCDMCGRSYGRLDTLRRHMKNTCPKREDIDQSYKFKRFAGRD